MRNQRKDKRAVIVASSAAPAPIARVSTQMVGLMKKSAGLFGARTVGVLFMGLAAQQPKQQPGEADRKQARRLGKKLVAGP